MRIAIDSSSYQEMDGGGRTFLHGLLTGFSDLKVRVTVYGPESLKSQTDPLGSTISHHLTPGHSNRAQRELNRLQFQKELHAEGTADLLYFPFNLGAHQTFPSLKQVTTMHDFLAWDYPECVKWTTRILRKYFVKKSFKNADGIVFSSNYTQSRAQHYYPKIMSSKPTDVVYISYFAPPLQQPWADAEKYAPYILHLGVGRKNKNLYRLTQAVALLKSRGKTANLVIAGQVADKTQAEMRAVAASHGAEDLLHFTGFIDEADKAGLIHGAAVFAFPSYYEGFGIPVVEARAYGVRTVVSNAASLPEVAGSDSVMVDPFSVKDIADGLATGLSMGPVSNRNFPADDPINHSWTNAAEQYLAFFEKVLTNKSMGSTQ